MKKIKKIKSTFPSTIIRFLIRQERLFQKDNNLLFNSRFSMYVIYLLPIAISIFALGIAYYTYKLAMDANELTKKSLNISETSNRIAIQSIEATKDIANFTNDIIIKGQKLDEKFASISAEGVWNTLLDSYNEIDEEIVQWEKSKKYVRNGPIVESNLMQDSILRKLKVPDNILRLYMQRYNKYTSLITTAQKYEPFNERLGYIDFSLPAAPRLPKGGIITGGGKGKITGGGKGIMTPKKKKKKSDN